jgi:hypothetical protein
MTPAGLSSQRCRHDRRPAAESIGELESIIEGRINLSKMPAHIVGIWRASQADRGGLGSAMIAHPRRTRKDVHHDSGSTRYTGCSYSKD